SRSRDGSANRVLEEIVILRIDVTTEVGPGTPGTDGVVTDNGVFDVHLPHTSNPATTAGAGAANAAAGLVAGDRAINNRQAVATRDAAAGSSRRTWSAASIARPISADGAVDYCHRAAVVDTAAKTSIEAWVVASVTGPVPAYGAVYQRYRTI